MNELVMIYPYYNNPEMLRLQVTHWNMYPAAVRDRVRLIVVDDGSAEPPTSILRQCDLRLQLYRIPVDLPFNMHEARNIGAQQAKADGEDPWMFMSDIDIVMPMEAMARMLMKDWDPRKHYTIEREFPDGFRKIHINTFLVRNSAFWRVGGYDLDLTVHGGGGYGGDNQFLRQLRGVVPEFHWGDVVSLGFGRRTREGQPVIADADTTSLSRDEHHKKYVARLQAKREAEDFQSKQPIRSAYVRVL
jgi:hypothetical protein